MTWIRVDDDCTNHPKFVRAGGKAGWLWLAGQGYCGRLRTDGLIPKMAAHLLQPGGKSLAAILVREGIWHDEGEHYRVHDYHDYQPSRAQIEERERQTVARVKAWRTRNGYAHGNALQACVATRVSTHPPVPDPDHEKKERKTGGGADAPPARRPTQGSGVMAGTLPRDHLRCVQPCGRVCFHESQLTEFARAHGGDLEDAKTFVRAWHERVNTAWGSDGPRAHEPTGAEKFAFWRDRWHEDFAPVRVPSRRKESADDVVERIKRELGAV